MNGKKIGFDLDGVVYNFMDSFDAFAASCRYSLKDDSAYNIAKRFGVGEKDAKIILNGFGETRPFKWIPLIYKAKEEMIRLSLNNEIYIVTYRDWCKQGIEDTIERIKRDNLPVNLDNIIFSKHKGKYAKELNLDIFYEDSIENVIDIFNKSDCKPIIVNKCYNQTTDKRFERVNW